MSKRKPLRILSLDGGDASCMSQLHVLDELMYRLQEKKGKRSIRPCEYFDLIVGVDGSGLIAVLLGLFKMTPEEAQEAFFNTYSAVFEDDSYLPEQRAIRLESSIRELLRIQGLLETVKLSDNAFRDTCKVALCYAPAVRLDHCKMLRNYHTPRQPTQDITVIQAIRATWATPGLISPVLIGPSGREEKIVSAIYGFSNPVQEVVREAFNVFGSDAQVSLLLSLGSGHRGIISLNDGTQSVGIKLMKDGEILADDIENRLGHLGIYHRLSVDRGLEKWDRSIDGFGAIKSHVDAYLARAEPNSKLEQCVAEKAVPISLEQLYRPKAPVLRRLHGLPPLSAYFVMRKKPMEILKKYLIERSSSGQRIAILSGLGGGGKTQLALKFARDSEENYRHILFIDASSAESIKKDIITRVGTMSPENPPKTVEEAINILANPDEEVTMEWLIIFDNADDPNVNYSDFLPQCDHGSILMTTRDPSMEALAPGFHLMLEVMDPDEAIKALLSCAFPIQEDNSTTARSLVEESIPQPTTRDHQAAAAIAEELGYLPIAIIQAGCYIRQHRALHQYHDHLKSNRSEVLKHATRVHRDKLKYPRGVYACFDITLGALSPRAVQLLEILSFFHFSSIPRLLLTIAAKSKFLYDPYDLLDRPEDFNDAARYLNSVLCPNGEWNEIEVDHLFEELQKYSLVTPVSSPMVTFRFHPLVFSWTRDRLTSAEEVATSRAAAIRLLVSGITRGDDYYLYDHLSLHVAELSAIFDELHVNDKAILSSIIFHTWDLDHFSSIWTTIHQSVAKIHGKVHIRTTRALAELGAVAWWKGDLQKAEEIQRNIMKVRETSPSATSSEVFEARMGLARVIRGHQRYLEAGEMQISTLQKFIKTMGLIQVDVGDGMVELAETLSYIQRRKEEQHLLLTAVSVWTKLLGSSARRTIFALQTLAQCYINQDQYLQAEELQRRILEVHQSIHGTRNLNTAMSMAPLAKMYHLQGRYSEAEQLRISELEIRRALQGNRHPDTLNTISWLAAAYFQQYRHKDAEQLLVEELEGRRELYSVRHTETLNTMHNLARTRYQMKRWAAARELWLEELENRREVQGNTHIDTLEALYWLGKTYYIQEYYYDAEKVWREELEARKTQDKPELTQRVTWYLSLMLNAIGRYEEAKEVAEITVRARRELDFDPNDARLIASTRLLDEIISKIPVHSNPKLLITGPANIQIGEGDAGTNGLNSELAAPDPGGDPTYSVPSHAALPVVQPRSPFSLRGIFAGRPNSWSMF